MVENASLSALAAEHCRWGAASYDVLTFSLYCLSFC